MRVRTVCCAAAVAALAFVSLSACDQKLASQPARDHRSVDGSSTPAFATSGDTTAPTTTAGRAEASAPGVGAPVRTIQGKPMWADNRRHSADENAQYQFEHHGTELGARDLNDFLVKAHRFVNAPPAGALTLTRANGDKLLFDPGSGLFGVVRSDGAPRTVTKPGEGKAFWDKQVEENRTGGTRTAARAKSDDRS
jgi:pyocin large subunit-like protein